MSTKEDGKLRKFSDTVWTTLKNAAFLRKKLKSNRYIEVTRTLLLMNHLKSTISYHPLCHKNYTAVKRPKDVSDDEPITKRLKDALVFFPSRTSRAC